MVLSYSKDFKFRYFLACGDVTQTLDLNSLEHLIDLKSEISFPANSSFSTVILLLK